MSHSFDTRTSGNTADRLHLNWEISRPEPNLGRSSNSAPSLRTAIQPHAPCRICAHSRNNEGSGCFTLSRALLASVGMLIGYWCTMVEPGEPEVRQLDIFYCHAFLTLFPVQKASSNDEYERNYLSGHLQPSHTPPAAPRISC